MVQLRNAVISRILASTPDIKQIYLPCYKWVLENKLQKLVTAIRIISKNKPVVLLDYNTNPDVYNAKSPLSHASLIKAYIEGNYPE